MPDKPDARETRKLSRALPIPDPLYPCSAKGCREEHTWPSFDLAWFSGREEGVDPEDEDLKVHAADSGWYCPPCCDRLEIECDGPSLAETLAARTAPGEPMPDEEALVHALNMAGDEHAPHAAALHEVARRMLNHTAGCAVLPAYDPDTPLEGEAAAFPAMEIARRERENPFTLRAVTLSPPLATRIGLELQHMSLLLQKADQAKPRGPRSRRRLQ